MKIPEYLLPYIQDEIIKDLEYLEILYNYTLEHKPSLVLETGTYTGRSAIVIGTAMKTNGKGMIITVDNNMWKDLDNRTVIQRSLEIALASFHLLGLDNIKYINCDCLNPTEFITSKHYDFVFLDSYHSYDHVSKELEIYGKLADAVFIHDTRSHEGVDKAVWHYLSENKGQWKLIHFYTSDGLWLIERVLE